ncbi:MAG TPA: sugar kinase [Anaeromyxobacteraceae bacterium]|nr:sugar kinase [Anaeromyxobacteraceae bacterium]
MSRVVTMGEMMARFMPSGNLRIEQAGSFDVFYGGDESIVAASLARLGMDVAYVTRLPDNPLGRAALASIRAQGVDTRFVSFGGKRMGLNFYENGAAMRPSRVIYDRADSAMGTAGPSHFDLDAIFRGASWFHVSGITPALSESTRQLTETALAKAKQHGLTVSLDLNYRRKLWTPERAREVMTSLMSQVDVCIGNEEDAEITLGFAPEDTDVSHGKLSIEGYKRMLRRMMERFSFRYVASTLRESRSASDNGWSAILYDGKDFCVSRSYDIHLVDRGGGGASFSAGLIYALSNAMPPQETVEFAAAASALKQTVLGDYNITSLDEVRELLSQGSSGRVQR